MKGSIPLCWLVLLLAPAAFAAETPPVPESGEPIVHVGRLAEVDHARHAFSLETATELESFVLVEGARVTEGGVDVGFDALSVGQSVAVVAVPNGGHWLARSVEIVGPDDVAAQVVEEPAIDETDTVTITAVDVEGRRLHVDTVNGPLFYRIAPDTRIERDGVAIELEDLAVGERVVIAAEETSPGTWTARTVMVVAEEARPAGLSAFTLRTRS